MDHFLRSRLSLRLRPLAAFACLALLVASGPVVQPAAAAPGVPRAAAPTGPAVPGAPKCQMFPADNVWNTDISKLPVNKNSATWMANMASATTNLHPDFGPNEGGYPYGIPWTVINPKTQAFIHLRFEYADESDKGPYPFGPTTPIEGGLKASGDRHAIMVDPATCVLYELWDAQYVSPTASTAGSGAIWNLNSNALRPASWTSADAAGLPILPGLLKYQEVLSGKVDHAIRFTAQCTDDAYIWPARHQAGSCGADYPPMGARFRLSAGFSASDICKAGSPYCSQLAVIIRAMQHYGLILADNGSNWYFQGSAFPQWPITLVNMMKQIPARDFVAVDESCLEVSSNSGEASTAHCPEG
jgi:hypothetical protein